MTTKSKSRRAPAIKKGSAAARALGELTSVERQFLSIIGYIGTERAMHLVAREHQRCLAAMEEG